MVIIDKHKRRENGSLRKTHVAKFVMLHWWWIVKLIVCVCVCVCVRERERGYELFTYFYRTTKLSNTNYHKYTRRVKRRAF